MKKGSHKNQIIITTLALLLAVVGYISYDNRDTFMNAKDVLSTEIEAVNGKADTKESKECEDTQASDEVALETDSTEEILNAGETVLTSASTESEECVAQVKLGREQVRSKNKEALQKIIDDAGVSEAEKKSAVDAMVKLTENAQMEEDAQFILHRLEDADGFLPYHDKSAPEEIKSLFHMSKNAFKRAIGRLMKEGFITIGKDGIRLK